MATNQEPSDQHTAVALQAWTNDKIVALEKAIEIQLRDLRIHYDSRLDEREKALNAALKTAEAASRNSQEHFEKILIEKDNALRAALAAAEKAVQKAEDNAQRWQENANEWRAAMTDKDKLLLTRTEFEGYKTMMTAAMSAERSRADKDEGKGLGLNMGWSILLAVVGALGVLIGIAGVITRFMK